MRCLFEMAMNRKGEESNGGDEVHEGEKSMRP